MKTVLDLIAEFGALNDAKMRTGSNLSPGDEERWAELKAFYELSMTQEGLDLIRSTPPIGAADIRERLNDRERIRVPTDAAVVFQHARQHFTGRVVNLSRGGLFLASERLFEIGACLEICLSEIGRDTEELFEVRGKVAWPSSIFHEGWGSTSSIPPRALWRSSIPTSSRPSPTISPGFGRIPSRQFPTSSKARCPR
jgi:PilZ domain